MTEMRFCIYLQYGILFQYPSNYVADTSNAYQDYVNINTLWASLIIEECCRLGLTVRLHDGNKCQIIRLHLSNLFVF